MTIAQDRSTAGIRRHFTKVGRHPYEEVTWERRTARITNFRDSTVAFEQLDVEVPVSWSFNATNILAQKYFRGTLGTPGRESSLKQVVDRVVDTITNWGRQGNYFADADEANAFSDELKHLIIHQKAAFNSPVWFNIGVKDVPQQASACFILSVEDSMSSILNWYVEEGTIFKGGSGAGVNLSRIRSSKEPLGGGGTASGPVSFMRGADASAGTIKSGGKTRRAAKMVILNVDHPDIRDFIWCKAIEERKARVLAAAGFDMDLDGKDGISIQYQNANNSVRVTDEFMEAVEADRPWPLTARTDGSVIEVVSARELFREIAQAAHECADPGLQFDTTINRWHTSPSAGRINASNPCSEYMHLDNSACNLASLNLLKFLDENGGFDVAGFKAATELMFTAQEILVGFADYPTPSIGENARQYRELGLGYANLGALLMAVGLPYDSDAGRAWAGAITSLMTAQAYATSARIAGRLGPCTGYQHDQDAMATVMAMHRRAAESLAQSAGVDEVPEPLRSEAVSAWSEAQELLSRNGIRNTQATVLAPTGTIGLLMDCDTTGIEPDLALVKTKKLVGGGTMAIVNQTVPRALGRLGYSPSEIEEIVGHIDRHKSILGAPNLKPQHLGVFACSMGDNPIDYMGHIRMMAAVQPFISGAISKTVNMPESSTVEEIEQLYMDAWRMGLKAVAIYRDNCKLGQPLSTTKSQGSSESTAPESGDQLQKQIADLEQRLAQATSRGPSSRARLPKRRNSETFAFRVADCEGYATVGKYEDGRPGELFLKVSKQGSTLAGIVDAFSIAVSLGLQHGVPLSTFVSKYTNMRFEPAGLTDDPDLRIATSLVDFIFRRLALDHLSEEERRNLGILSTQERTQPALPGLDTAGVESAPLIVDAPPVSRPGRPAPWPMAKDAPYCFQCGNAMQRAGSCYVCSSCGTTSGCS